MLQHPPTLDSRIYIERRFLAPIIDGCLAGNAPHSPTFDQDFGNGVFILVYTSRAWHSRRFKMVFFRARTHFSSVLRAKTVSRFLFFFLGNEF